MKFYENSDIDSANDETLEQTDYPKDVNSSPEYEPYCRYRYRRGNVLEESIGFLIMGLICIFFYCLYTGYFNSLFSDPTPTPTPTPSVTRALSDKVSK